MRPARLGLRVFDPRERVARELRRPLPRSAATARARRSRKAEVTGATLRLATAIEESTDAGADKPALPSLTGKIVLHVGDSMVGGNWGLTKALEQRFVGEGAKFIHDYKVSESIVSYDHSPKLKDLLAKHKPDIVIITLGTNDVFVPFPASMTGNIQNIVSASARASVTGWAAHVEARTPAS